MRSYRFRDGFHGDRNKAAILHILMRCLRRTEGHRCALTLKEGGEGSARLAWWNADCLLGFK
jgi:hypothetical protein